MNLYSVTIVFYIGLSESATTLTIKRKAHSASEAISVITSLIGNLSNYTTENGVPEISVYSTTATKLTQ